MGMKVVELTRFPLIFSSSFKGKQEARKSNNSSIDLIYILAKHYINITFSERVIVKNIIPRNVIINRGAAEVDNHISRDDT